MIKQREFSILVEQLDIKPIEVVKYMSGNNDDIPELFIDLAENELNKIAKESTQMFYHLVPAKLNGNQLKIQDINFNVGAEVFEMLTNINSVVVFACTVGKQLDIKLHQYNAEQITESYISDVIGTIIIEKSMELIYQELQIQIQKTELNMTNTISPGNCGWPVEEQKKIFQLLPDHCLEIKLNDSGMMQPVKSLSGIVGIGKSVKFKHTDCKQCASKNCLYRKAS